MSFQEKYQVPGSVEWAINWSPVRDGFLQSYGNTVPTPEGGTHEFGFWSAILKGIRAYGELSKNRKAELITRDDMLTGGCALISVFIREPQFVGQTKDRLATEEANRWVEGPSLIHISITAPSRRPNATAAGRLNDTITERSFARNAAERGISSRIERNAPSTRVAS